MSAQIWGDTPMLLPDGRTITVGNFAEFVRTYLPMEDAGRVDTAAGFEFCQLLGRAIDTGTPDAEEVVTLAELFRWTEGGAR